MPLVSLSEELNIKKYFLCTQRVKLSWNIINELFPGGTTIESLFILLFESESESRTSETRKYKKVEKVPRPIL